MQKTQTIEYRQEKESVRAYDLSVFSRWSPEFSVHRGFTLIELLVSVAVFSVVMLIAIGSLLSMVEANRKAQSLKSVVNNLSFGLDGMARTLRDGTTLHCGSVGALNIAMDCSNGDTYLAVEKYGGNPNITTDQYVYCLGSGNTCSSSGTSILRSTDGGATFLPITAPEVTITKLLFLVRGAPRSETPKIQPRIVMVIRGYAGINARVRTEIKLETTITQRFFDE